MDHPLPPARPRLAVVLFNLGGPDSRAAIKPFLVNLFSDRAILRVPGFVRFFLARLIAARRLAPATANYEILGGRSPLLELTKGQARALETALAEYEARAFVAMRYWHPFARETAREVRDWRPERVLLLPLYPQYSTTTTGSSLTDWREAAAWAGLVAPTTTLCCWFADPGFASASAALLRTTLARARAGIAPGTGLRVLFSAHGLPESIIAAGDPYQFQVERSVAAVRAALGEEGLDWRICYQSRATPQKWLDPSTDAEIAQAGREGLAVVVVPIAFVSEHSETLVELDVEYGELAKRSGVAGYFRVPAANDEAGFIAALADLARAALGRGVGLCSHAGGRLCPAAQRDCPHARAGVAAPATEAVR